MTIGSLMSRMGTAEKLSVAQIQQAIKNGTLPAYVGIPMIQEKMKAENAMRSQQPAQQQPSIAEEVMAQAGAANPGIPQLESNLPAQGMAAGGIVALASGGSYEDDTSDDDIYDSYDAAEASRAMDDSGMAGAIMRASRGPKPVQAAAAPTPYTGPGAGALESLRSMFSKSPASAPAKAPINAFQHALDFVLPHEGGYVNDKADRGGPTNYGVTKRTLEGYLGKKVSDEDVQNMPVDLAKKIYKEQYWDKINGDKLDPRIAMLAFDTAVGSGVSKAKKMLDQYGDDPEKFLEAKKQWMRDIVKRDPSQQKFDKGWQNRMNNLGEYIQQLPSANQTGIASLAGGGKVPGLSFDDEDYSIPGYVAGTMYEDSMRRAKGLPTLAEEKERTRGFNLPANFMTRINAPLNNDIPDLQQSTLYADALRKAQGTPREVAPAEAEQGITQLAPANPRRNNPMSVTGPGDSRWGRDLGMDNPNPNGPSATPDMMKRIEALGGQLDSANEGVRALMKSRPSLRNPGLPDWQDRFEAANARKNNLQSQYEKLMEANGMNQAAFGVYRGALGTTPPMANPMVQAMSAPQEPRRATAGTSTAGAGRGKQGGPTVADLRRAEMEKAIGLTQDTEDMEGGQAAAAQAATAQLAQSATKEAAKSEPSSMDEYLQMLKGGYEDVKKQREEDKYLALLAAGLGMMGGTSPFAAANIGQGGLQGVASLAAANKERGAEKAAVNRAYGQALYRKNLAESTQAGREAQLQELIRGHDLQAEAARGTLTEKQMQNAQNNLQHAIKLVSSAYKGNIDNAGKPQAEEDAFVYSHPLVRKAAKTAGIDISGLGTTGQPKINEKQQSLLDRWLK